MAQKDNTKVCQLPKELKAEALSISDAYEVSGYLAVYNTVDQVDDIIVPGAIDLAELENLPMLFQHDMKEPIGVWTKFENTEFGLRVTGNLAKGVKRAEEVKILYDLKALKGLSIGYSTLDAGWEGDIRYLKRIRLREGSVVVNPAHLDAEISSIKSRGFRNELVSTIRQAFGIKQE